MINLTQQKIARFLTLPIRSLEKLKIEDEKILNLKIEDLNHENKEILKKWNKKSLDMINTYKNPIEIKNLILDLQQEKENSLQKNQEISKRFEKRLKLV